MILADKIINERKKLGWSQEDLADKLDVSRQSVSKWESAQSTPDLGRILKMAELFGVSTDYLLKDEMDENDLPGTAIVEDTGASSASSLKFVSMEEASAYLDAVESTTPKIAIGVSLCILSPVLLITLAGLSETPLISEAIAVVAGISALLILVAIGVFIFIMTNRRLEPYEYLEDVAIDTAYGVDGMVREKKSRFEKKHSLFTAIGVVMCILSCIPLIAVGVIASMAGNESIIPAMVGVLLILVAVGVNFIIRVNNIMESYNKLLQEGEYTLRGKRANKVTKKIAGIYWPIVLGGYLAWSFITMKWEMTWIVWPVAAVLFGAVCGITKSFMRD